MKPQDFNQLLNALVEQATNETTSPVRTNRDCTYQDFDVFTDENQRLELAPGLSVSATVFESGSVYLSLNFRDADKETHEKVLAAYKRLRAKNLCKLAAERAQDSARASLDADELVNQAAALLGIPVAEAEKIAGFNNQNEEA